MNKTSIKKLNAQCSNGFYFDETSYTESKGKIQRFIKPFMRVSGNVYHRFLCALQFEEVTCNGFCWYTLTIYSYTKGLASIAKLDGSSGKTRKDLRTLANITNVVDDSYLEMVFKCYAPQFV